MADMGVSTDEVLTIATQRIVSGVPAMIRSSPALWVSTMRGAGTATKIKISSFP